MNSRATLSLLLPLAIAASALATDFEIVVPDTDAFRKAGNIVVFDTSGQLKKGDRVTKITYGGLPNGTGNSRVVADGGTVNQPVLGVIGSVNGFAGKVQLGAGQGPNSAPLGGVVEVKIAAAPPVTEGLWAKMMAPPWVWLFAFGSAALVSFIVLNMRIRGSYFMANKNSRNAFLDAVAEIKERLEGVETAQHNLVKKPPVLKHFDTQIKSFDSRLSTLETNVVQNHTLLSAAGEHLDTLDTQFAKLGAGADAAQRDYSNVQSKLERLDQSVSATSGSLTTKFQQLFDKQQAMDVSLGSLGKLEESVRGLQKDIASSDSRLRALAEQVGMVERRSVENTSKLADSQNELTGQVTVLANQLSAVTTHIENSNSSVDGLSQALSRVEAAIGKPDAFKDVESQLQASLGKLSEELKTIGSDNSKLKADFAALGKGFVQQFENLQAAVKELHRAQSNTPNLAELVSAVETQKGSKSSKDSEAGDLRFKALASDLASMRQEMEARMETLSAPLGNLGKLKSEIEDKMSALTEPLSNLAAMRADMETKINSLAGPIEELLRQSNAQPKVVYVQPETKSEPVQEQPSPEPVAAQVVLEPTKKPVVEEPVGEVEPEVVEEIPAAKVVAASANDEPDSDDDSHSFDALSAWNCAGGTAAKLWSASIGGNMGLLKSDKPVRPLTPVDTPAAKHSVGAAAYLDGRVIYAHGDAIRAFWPGKDENSVSLYGAMQHDDWRFLLNKRTAFCVQADRVEIISLTGWSTQHVFNGHYVGQVHTGEFWAGLVVQDDALSVDFRDNSGNQLGKPRKLKVPMNEKAYMAASGKDVFVLTESGKLFLVDGEAVHVLSSFSASKTKALHLAAVRNTVYALLQNNGHITVASYDVKKGVIKEVEFDGKANRQPVIMGDRMYISSESSNEITVVNLRKMAVIETKTVVGALGVRKMVGLQSGKEHFLGMVTKDFDNKAGRAVVYDVKSGTELTLCPVDQPHVDLVPADNKLVVITSTSYQNIVRVFAPFVAEARAAA